MEMDDVFLYIRENLRLEVGDASFHMESCPSMTYAKVPIRLILTSPSKVDCDLGGGDVIVETNKC